MKGPQEEGYSLVWHSVWPWFEAYAPHPATARAHLGRLIRDHGRDQVILAFDRTLEAHPRPVDPFTYFLKIVASATQRLGDVQSAWNTVMALSSNSVEAMSQASPRINEAIRLIGGWNKVGFCDARALGQLRMMFIEAYQGVRP